VIVLVLAVAGVLVWWWTGSSTDSSGGVFVQSVSDVNTAGSAIANRYSGVVETQKTEEINFDTSKTLKELLVSEGDYVYEGDPLFSYDTQSTELEIQQAELEVERLNTNISNSNAQIAQLQKDMNSASSSDKLGYSAQIQQLQADVAQAEYDIKSKQAEIDKLKASLDSATVCATMTGTVLSIADVESIINGTNYGSDGNFSDVYITILAGGDYRIKGTVSEQNIYEISEGMDVIVRSRVDESQTWTGTITTIDTSSTVSDSNNYYYSSGESASNYAFYVDLDSIDGLMLGQHVTIEMDYGQTEVKDGIWLNSGWIVQEEDGSAYVWAAKSAGAKLEKRSVTLGDYDEDLDQYQIASGLENSDYLAWPDVDCVVGAATTTEYVWDDSDFDMDDSYGMDEDGMMDDSFSMDEEGELDDSFGMDASGEAEDGYGMDDSVSDEADAEPAAMG
jgi:HlyD family secretion protein